MTTILAWALVLLTAFGVERWELPTEPTPVAWTVTTQEPPPDNDACVTVAIGRDDDGSPFKAGKTYVNIDEPWMIRTDIIGTFLWVQFDRETSTIDENVSSIPIPQDATEITVCR